MLIFAADRQQIEKLLCAETLNEETISSHIPGTAAKRAKSVIYDLPLESTKEEKGGKMVKATNQQMQRKGVKTDSLLVVLEFQKIILKRVRMRYLSFDVREFIPAPLRCFKSQRMRYTASQCKGKIRCARCGKEQEYGSCPVFPM